MAVNILVDPETLAIAFWWKQVRSYHRMFFRLVDEDIENLQFIPNLDLCINTLEHRYMDLIRLAFPPEAETIRLHLFSATRHLIDCLRRLKKTQSLESTLLLNLASSEMAMLRYELMALGIS